MVLRLNNPVAAAETEARAHCVSFQVSENILAARYIYRNATKAGGAEVFNCRSVLPKLD